MRRILGLIGHVFSDNPSVSFSTFSLLLLAAALVRGHFAILTNDYFPLLDYARSLSFCEPSTWYSGFYPIGSAILLRVADVVGTPSSILLVLNVIAGGIVTYSLIRTSTKLCRKEIAMILGAVLLSLPLFLRAALTPLPEVLIMMLFVVGVHNMLKGNFSIAALLIGITPLLRTHLIMLVLPLAVGWLYWNRTRAGLRTALLLVAPSLVLVFANLLSGHGAFETGQSFNVARQMYGVDWLDPRMPHESIFQLAAIDTGQFVRVWLANIVQNALPVMLLGFGFYWSFRRRIGDLSVIFLASLVYLLVASLGGSSNVLLPILPIILLCLGLLLHRIPAKADRYIGWITPLWLIAIFVVVQITIVAPALRVRHYEHIAKSLSVKNQRDAARILSLDLSLYFPGNDDSHPAYLGGWGSLKETNALKPTDSGYYNRFDWLLLRSDQAGSLGRLPIGPRRSMQLDQYILINLSDSDRVAR